MPDPTVQPATAKPPAIEMDGIAASSGGYEILADVSVAFPEGRCSVVMGGAGSGKSTLLKVAAGLIVPDRGTVRFRGTDMAHFSRADELAFRATTGYVFQDAALWSDTNILGNVAMPLRVHKHWMGESDIAEAVRVLMKRLGYDEGMAIRPAELSMGEQKLVGIARAVIHDPSVLFMDDPTSNLDEDASERVFELIGELKAKKKTIIVLANSSELAYRFADMLGIIKGRTLAAFGTYESTVETAESGLGASLARLRARGIRGSGIPERGSGENSAQGDV